jgi:hypothetical protein
VTVTSVLNQIPAQGTTKNTAVGFPTYASIRAVSDTVSPDGNTIEGDYVYSTTTPDLAAKLSWRINYNPKTDTTRRTQRLELVETRTTDALPAVLYPVSIDIAWTMVGRIMYDTAEVMTSLEFAFGALFKSVDANGVPNTSVLDAINLGIAGNAYA